MRKDGFRAFIIVIVSMLIITGAGLFTNVLLDNMEQKLLGQTGKTFVRQTGISQTSYRDYDEYVVAGEEDVELSLSDRHKILCSWADAERSIQHVPMNGQLTKQEAVKIGKKWIDNLMKNQYILIDDYDNANFTMEYAELSTVYSIEVEDSELLSMWNISYTYDDNRILVTIHAVTGEVWRTVAATYPSYGKWQKDEYGEIIENSYNFAFNGEDGSVSYIDKDENENKAKSSGMDEEPEAIIADEWSKELSVNYAGNDIEVSMRGNWLVTEYDGEYYSSLKSILSGKKYDDKAIDSRKPNTYYMQAYTMVPYEGSNIGFRITKAEQCNEDGRYYYTGFVMSMLPYEMANEVVEGFDIYSPVYDK